MGALRADAVSRPSDRVLGARFRTPSGDDALPDAFHGADHCAMICRAHRSSVLPRLQPRQREDVGQ